MVSEGHLRRVLSSRDAERCEAKPQRDRVRADVTCVAQEGERPAPEASERLDERRARGDPEGRSESALQSQTRAMDVRRHPDRATAPNAATLSEPCRWAEKAP